MCGLTVNHPLQDLRAPYRQTGHDAATFLPADLIADSVRESGFPRSLRNFPAENDRGCDLFRGSAAEPTTRRCSAGWVVKNSRMMGDGFPDNFEVDQIPPAIARMFSPRGDGAVGAAIHIERRTTANPAAVPVPSTEIRRRLPNRQKLTPPVGRDRQSLAII
jgi:hypothetical protein